MRPGPDRPESAGRGALTSSLLLLGVTGAFVAAPSASAARRPHCAAIPVAGQPGTFVVVCSTARA